MGRQYQIRWDGTPQVYPAEVVREIPVLLRHLSQNPPGATQAERAEWQQLALWALSRKTVHAYTRLDMVLQNEHKIHAHATDQPVAGLLKDLKQRGLLEDTLVWWGGEFGRTPFSQGKDGRDHNPRGFTTWLAGGGTKPGHAHGATDEVGDTAVSGRLHMHDLHATMLHLLGLAVVVLSLSSLRCFVGSASHLRTPS